MLLGDLWTTFVQDALVLRTKARVVTDFSDVPLLAADMLETMYDARGVGLAAPQIGLSKRIFVWAEFEDEEEEG